MKETQCYECFNIFYNFSFFEMITFDLSFYKNKNYFNIYNGFIDYFKEKIMKGENQCFCKMCMKLTESKVNSKIWSTPLYLIIYFDYGKDNENIQKKYFLLIPLI